MRFSGVGGWSPSRQGGTEVEVDEAASPGMTTARTWEIVVEVKRFQRARAMKRSEKTLRGEARWREWRRMLDEGVYATKAELARGEGVSRAAVTTGLIKLHSYRV